MSVRVSKDHGILAMDMKNKTVVAKLFADTKEDVTTDIITGELEGKPVGYTLDFESYAITSAGDIGILDSNETWNWVGEEEEGTRSVATLAKSAPVAERQQIEEPTEELKREEPEEIEEPIEDEDDMR